MKLVSVNFGGNLHTAVQIINDLNAADFVLTMNSNGRKKTIAILRVPNSFSFDNLWEQYNKARNIKEKAEWAE